MHVYSDRIVADPAVMMGKPVIKGTRLTVEFILELIVQGWTIEEIQLDYPRITREDVLACVDFARQLVTEQRIFPTAA